MEFDSFLALMTRSIELTKLADVVCCLPNSSLSALPCQGLAAVVGSLFRAHIHTNARKWERSRDRAAGA